MAGVNVAEGIRESESMLPHPGDEMLENMFCTSTFDDSLVLLLSELLQQQI